MAQEGVSGEIGCPRLGAGRMGYDPTLLAITNFTIRIDQNIIAAPSSTLLRPPFLSPESVERILRPRDADGSRRLYDMQEVFKHRTEQNDKPSAQLYSHPENLPSFIAKLNVRSRSDENSNSSGQESRISSSFYYRENRNIPHEGRGSACLVHLWPSWNHCGGTHTRFSAGYLEDLQ